MMIDNAIVWATKTQKLGKNSLTIVFACNSSGIEQELTIADIIKKLKLNNKSFLTLVDHIIIVLRKLE